MCICVYNYHCKKQMKKIAEELMIIWEPFLENNRFFELMIKIIKMEDSFILGKKFKESSILISMKYMLTTKILSFFFLIS